MADNKKQRGGADRALIALSESYEVAYWSKKFKITPAKLKATVKKVDHSARKVEAYLNHACEAEGSGRRRRAFVEKRCRLSRTEESSQEDRQEEGRKEDRQKERQEDSKEKGRLRGGLNFLECTNLAPRARARRRRA